jgi:GNAT superfamily N-acetyltransferase
MPIVETVTDPTLAADVAAIAAATFPLACPPHSRPQDIEGFIAANLTPAEFEAHIAHPDSEVFVVRSAPDGPIIGYSLVHHRPPADPGVAAVVTEPSSEISKVYVAPGHHAHRTGVAASASRALMAAAIDSARAHGSTVAWLGCNEENARALRFYEKSGFIRAGTKTFDLNGTIEHDYVLVRPVDGRS